MWAAGPAGRRAVVGDERIVVLVPPEHAPTSAPLTTNVMASNVMAGNVVPADRGDRHQAEPLR